MAASRKPSAEAARGALVLDSEGLSAAARGDVRARAQVLAARKSRSPVVISAITAAETIRGTDRDAAVHWLIRRADVVDVDVDLAAEAGRLLGASRRDDTIDAVVAVTAGRQNRPVLLVTSDRKDMDVLTADMSNVTVVAV